MVDLDDVCAGVGDGGDNRGELAGHVRQRDAQLMDAPGADELAHQHRGQDAGVDVAPRQDDGHRLVGKPVGMIEKRRQCRRGGAFGHGLLNLEVEGDASFDGLLADHDDVVDEVAEGAGRVIVDASALDQLRTLAAKDKPFFLNYWPLFPVTFARNETGKGVVGELYLADISVPPDLFSEPGMKIEVGAIFAKDDIVRL